MWFQFFHRTLHRTLKKYFRSKQKIINWSLKWRLCDMKIIKWNSRKLTESKTTFDIPILKISSHIITWLTQRLTGTRILFLYTTTDCTHSHFNCVGVLPVIFLPSFAHAIIFIWPQLALQFKIFHSPLGDVIRSSQTVTRNKKFEKN